MNPGEPTVGTEGTTTFLNPLTTTEGQKFYITASEKTITYQKYTNFPKVSVDLTHNSKNL